MIDTAGYGDKTDITKRQSCPLKMTK